MFTVESERKEYTELVRRLWRKLKQLQRLLSTRIHAAGTSEQEESEPGHMNLFSFGWLHRFNVVLLRLLEMQPRSGAASIVHSIYTVEQLPG